MYTDDPGPPEDLTLTDVTNHPCMLTWKPPQNDGGAPITGYLVEWYNWSGWEQISSTPVEGLSTKIPGVGSELKVQVYAMNSVGQSVPSECTFTMPRREVPGCPEAPKVVKRTQHKATLRIIPPVDDGGLPISGYVIEMRSVSSTRWRTSDYTEEMGDDVEYTVTGIDSSCYEFRVIAVNGAGSGKPSPAVLSEFGNWTTNVM